jgi:Domain of unknown function (DUF4062)/NB-ARC domain
MPTVLPPLRIFLSSTDIDLHEHRTAVIEAILRMQQFPIDMRYFNAQAIGTSSSNSVERVADADVVILLIAWRYGSVQSDGLSITHQEYREAVHLGKPILAFLADKTTEAMDRAEDLFPSAKRDPDHVEQMRAFRQEVKGSGRIVDSFDIPADLGMKVAAALGGFVLQHQERFARCIPRNLPPRAPTFVGREHALAQIEADLRRGTNVAVAAAVAGMGGVGKSALAAEVMARIANDVTAFPGGITWIRCNDLMGWEGINSIYAQLLLEWDITVPPEALAGVSAAQQEAQIHAHLLRSRLALPGPALVLLDNVERDLPLQEILAMLASLSMTALVTSRIFFFLPVVKVWNLEVLAPDEAVALLRDRYRDKGGLWDEAHDVDIAHDIVAALGCLPLAIELAAARAAQLRMSIARLDEEMHATDVLAKLIDPMDPTRSVRYILGCSLDTLSAPERVCFTSLGIVSATDYPQDVLLALFRVLCDDDINVALQTLRLLIALSLLQPFEDDSIRRTRIHPLLHDLAAEEWDHQESAIQMQGRDGLLAGILLFVQAHAQDFAILAHDERVILEILHDAQQRTITHQEHIIDLTWAIDDYVDLQGRWKTYSDILHIRLETYQSLGDRAGEGQTLMNLGALADKQGRVDDAAAYYAQALSILREVGDLAGEG